MERRENVIELYGTLFPLAQRTIAWRGVTPFPQKVVIGDYSRADHIVESELVLSDFTGGIGVLWARPERDQDRYWFGNLDGRYRFLTLPPERVFRGNPGLVQRFIAYDDRVYAIAGNAILLWQETDQSWQQVGIFLGSFQDAAVYDGSLYLVTGSSLIRFDADTGTTTTYPGWGGFALVVWDDKLFRLDTNNKFWWSIDPGTSWEVAGRLLLPSGWCRQLLVYPDASGEPSIHAIAKDGVYVYDFASRRFYQTQFTYPATDRLGRATVWRGELYVPVGTIYKYNGAMVQVVGPDRDDGLPQHVTGQVAKVVAGHGYWFPVVLSPGRISGASWNDDWDLGMPNLPEGWFPGASQSGIVLMSPGTAFHVLAQYDEVSGFGDAEVLSASGTYRLWVSTTRGVYSIDLPTGLHNPLQNPTSRFADSGYLITSWWDLGWSNLEKLALGLVVNAVVPVGGSVRFSIAFDGDEQWQPVGEVTATGRFRFRVGPPEGIKFRQVRFLIEMVRGPDPRVAPYLVDATFTYLRAPKLLFGWEAVLQLTDPYCLETVGVSARDLVQRLIAIARERKAGTFRYRDENGNEVNSRVMLTELAATDVSGPYREGRYSISLVELES